MSRMQNRLALHTWTLDTTPLADALRAAKNAGWDAIELRRIDFTRCFEKGMTNAQVLDLVRKSGLKVACIGTEYGLVFAQGEERERLLKVLNETCANAAALRHRHPPIHTRYFARNTEIFKTSFHKIECLLATPLRENDFLTTEVLFEI